MSTMIRMRAERAPGQHVWRVRRHYQVQDVNGNVISSESTLLPHRFEEKHEAADWIATETARIEDVGEVGEWAIVRRDAR